MIYVLGRIVLALFFQVFAKFRQIRAQDYHLSGSGFLTTENDDSNVSSNDFIAFDGDDSGEFPIIGEQSGMEQV